MIKTKSVSQITGICCALCGEFSRVSNSEYDSETFELISDKTFTIVKYEDSTYLWFHCKYCLNDYKIPFVLENNT